MLPHLPEGVGWYVGLERSGAAVGVGSLSCREGAKETDRAPGPEDQGVALGSDELSQQATCWGATFFPPEVEAGQPRKNQVWELQAPSASPSPAPSRLGNGNEARESPQDPLLSGLSASSV